MSKSEHAAAEKKFKAAQKKVRRARQALANAEERRNFALAELRKEQRKSWLRSQAPR